MKKPIAVTAIVLVLVAAVGWYVLTRPSDERDTITLYGNVDIRDADLSFNDQEYVEEVLVEEGDAVSEGEVLARLRTRRLTAMIEEAEARVRAQESAVKRLREGTRKQVIEQARAAVRAAEARVNNAQRNVARLRQAAETGATSLQEVDDAEAALHVQEATLASRKEDLILAELGPREEDVQEAQALLEAHKASLNLLNVRLNEAQLVAPADGVIQSRILEPGEIAAPGRAALTLALLTPKWIRTYAPETDLGRIKEGMVARIRSDSFPDKRYEGWVGFISPVAEFTPKTVETEDLRTKLVYETRVYVHDPDNELRLGMPVTVTLTPGKAGHGQEQNTESTRPSSAAPPSPGAGAADGGADEE